MDVAIGVDNAMRDIGELGFGFRAFGWQIADLKPSFAHQSEEDDVVDGGHRMGYFAALGNELPTFVSDDRNVLF